MNIAQPIETETNTNDAAPHMSWGLRRLARSLVVDILPRPHKWLKAVKVYPPVVADILERRAYVKLLSYMSVGLPGEGEMPAIHARNSGFPRRVLKSLSRRSESSLEGLASTAWERVVVERAREIIQYANGKSLPDFDAIDSAERTEVARRTNQTPPRVLYVAHTRLIDVKNGYSVRTHHMAAALKRAGVEVAVSVRPSEAGGLTQVLDNVLYLAQAAQKTTTIAGFLDAYISSIEKHIEEFKPDIIHGASNWLTGAAASIAARKHGIPFVYEVRGFWEITRLASFSGYRRSAGFRAQRSLERQVATRAACVATLSDLMIDELEKRGVAREKVFCLPNCGIPQTQEDRKFDETETIVFGYVGSLVAYEGVDLLLKAFAVLRRENQSVKLVIAGSGAAEASLKQLAEKLELSQDVAFLGRFSPADTKQIYQQISVIVLPRRATQVTRLVSPLKPLEAFSFGKPCLVSDIPPLRHIVCESRAGLTFRPDSRHSLVNVMRVLATDDARRKSLSDAGKAFIDNQTWMRNAALLKKKYQKLSA